MTFRHLEWLKSDNIALSAIHPSRATEYLSAQGESAGRVVGEGSSLVVCINAVTPRGESVPAFVYGLLRAAKPLLQPAPMFAGHVQEIDSDIERCPRRPDLDKPVTLTGWCAKAINC